MLEKILENVAMEENLQDNDKAFFMRVWNTDPTIYKSRLKAIGFENLTHVLDAGSGFGQWAYALALLNKNVTALEYNPFRVAASSKVIQGMEINNCSFLQGSIDEIRVKDSSFDGIFAYSSILFTDYRKTLKEFYRILQPNGKLYFNANGLGWYLYNIIDGHNSTANFSSRQMGVDTIKNSLKFYTNGDLTPGTQILMLRDIVIKEMISIGYEIIAQGAEGTINLTNGIKITPFFKSEYYGEDGVFEIVAIKK
ncbi:MAG: class I SAM-dependent methyltransferase [Bacteroidota bacterium]